MATRNFDIRAIQEAARAKAEAAALAEGKSKLQADSIGNAAGNNTGAAELKKIQGELSNNASSDDNSKPVEGYTSDGGYVVNMSGTTGQKQGVSDSSNKAQTDQKYPGARKTNPLSNYSSYNYIITLYMITSEVQEKFVSSGGVLPTDPDSRNQTFIIAQSGGIGKNQNRALAYSERLGPNQAGFDYYIDDLSLQTQLTTGTPGSAYSFKIIEPIGYTFLTRLAKASNEINKLSKLPGVPAGLPPLNAQNYVLGISFVGYDVNGQVVNSSKIEPRYFCIRFSKMSFKISSGATIYNIDAFPHGEQAAQGLKNGVLPSTVEFNADKGTVGDALDKLMTILNKFQQTLVDNNKALVTNEYRIVYNNADEIKNAKLLDNTQLESQVTTMSSGVNTTTQSNIKQSVNAVTNKVQSRLTSFTTGAPITMIIDNLITKSEYVSRSLTKINNESLETQTETNDGKTEFKFYSCNIVVKQKDWDDKLGTWAYKITYEISQYYVPFIRSNLVTNVSQWKGPYKQYNYLLTGENTEVLDYDLQIDALYGVINPQVSQTGTPDNKTSKQTVGVGAMIIPMYGVNYDPTGGKLNRGSSMNESVRVQLGQHDSAGAELSNAKLKIMGDPDYLMTQLGTAQSLSESESSDSSNYFASKTVNAFAEAYGKDYTINPLSGQVHIQTIIYVGEDYNDLSYNNKPSNGLIDVSDEINFYSDASTRNSGIKGLILQVTVVTSKFNNGIFTQELNTTVVQKDKLVTSTSSSSNDSGRQSDSSTKTGDEVTTNTNTRKADLPTYRVPGTTYLDDGTKVPEQYDEFGKIVPVVSKNAAYKNEDQSIPSATSSRSETTSTTENRETTAVNNAYAGATDKRRRK